VVVRSRTSRRSLGLPPPSPLDVPWLGYSQPPFRSVSGGHPPLASDACSSSPLRWASVASCAVVKRVLLVGFSCHRLCLPAKGVMHSSGSCFRRAHGFYFACHKPCRFSSGASTSGASPRPHPGLCAPRTITALCVDGLVRVLFAGCLGFFGLVFWVHCRVLFFLKGCASVEVIGSLFSGWVSLVVSTRVPGISSFGVLSGRVRGF
jgi:hypothetical protein